MSYQFGSHWIVIRHLCKHIHIHSLNPLRNWRCGSIKNSLRCIEKTNLQKTAVHLATTLNLNVRPFMVGSPKDSIGFQIEVQPKILIHGRSFFNGRLCKLGDPRVRFCRKGWVNHDESSFKGRVSLAWDYYVFGSLTKIKIAKSWANMFKKKLDLFPAKSLANHATLKFQIISPRLISRDLHQVCDDCSFPAFLLYCHCPD